MGERIRSGSLLVVLVVLYTACGSHEYRSAGESARYRPFTLRFVGDAILTISINQYVDRHGIGYPLSRLKGYLQGADFTVANLESCFTTRGVAYRRKKYVFRARPGFMAILRDAGVDAVSLANNHLLDYGQEGMRDTFRALARFGIAGFGAGASLDESFRPLTIQPGGTVVHLFSLNDVYPQAFHAGERRAGTAPLDLEWLSLAISRFKRPGDLVIVQPHWGWELRALPNARQVRQARAMIDAGADAVIGHHPHVPQSIEVYRGRPIVYSLGNFIVGFWNMGYRNNIGVTLHGYRGRITGLRIHSIAGRNLQTGFRPHLVRGEAGKRDMRYLQAISRPFGTRMEILPDGSARVMLSAERRTVAAVPRWR